MKRKFSCKRKKHFSSRELNFDFSRTKSGRSEDERRLNSYLHLHVVRVYSVYAGDEK